MKSLTLFALCILAAAMIGCGDSSMNPQKIIPDYVHAKNGTSYILMDQRLDSTLQPDGAPQTGSAVIEGDNMYWDGRSGVIRLNLASGKDEGHYHFDDNGDYEKASADDSIHSEWIRYPFYSKQTFNYPSVDSTDAGGYRLVTNGTIIYDGTDTVIIGGTTFNAIRAIETTNRNTYYESLKRWEYSIMTITHWFIPKLGFIGKSYYEYFKRDQDQKILQHGGIIERLVSYDIKQ